LLSHKRNRTKLDLDPRWINLYFKSVRRVFTRLTRYRRDIQSRTNEDSWFKMCGCCCWPHSRTSRDTAHARRRVVTNARCQIEYRTWWIENGHSLWCGGVDHALCAVHTGRLSATKSDWHVGRQKFYPADISGQFVGPILSPENWPV